MGSIIILAGQRCRFCRNIACNAAGPAAGEDASTQTEDIVRQMGDLKWVALIVDRDRDAVMTVVFLPLARDQGELDNDKVLDLLDSKIQTSKAWHPAGNRGNGVVQRSTKFVAMQDGAGSRGLGQGGLGGQRHRRLLAVDRADSSLVQLSAGLWTVFRRRKVPRTDEVLFLGVGFRANFVCLGCLGPIDGSVGVGRLGLQNIAEVTFFDNIAVCLRAVSFVLKSDPGNAAKATLGGLDGRERRATVVPGEIVIRHLAAGMVQTHDL